MASTQPSLDRIRQYASHAAHALPEPASSEPDHALTDARIQRTLEQLQTRVSEQEAALAELRNSAPPTSATRGRSSDLRVAIRQLRTLTSAYEHEAQREPFLPPPDSALPALLAARLTQHTVSELKTSIRVTRGNLVTAEHDAQKEESNLIDARAIQSALQSRIAQSRDAQQTRTQQSAADSIRDRIQARQALATKFNGDAKRLRQLLDAFIETHLAAMLAAEELGGPVVGDLMDIDDETLAAGFSQQGKPRPTASARRIDADTRQRRIDEIWGPTSEPDDEGTRRERDVAADELQELVDQLMEALVGSLASSPYVELQRDSAAARFLVRAKVAQFHPRDAAKIRLIDFGRLLDD